IAVGRHRVVVGGVAVAVAVGVDPEAEAEAGVVAPIPAAAEVAVGAVVRPAAPVIAPAGPGRGPAAPVAPPPSPGRPAAVAPPRPPNRLPIHPEISSSAAGANVSSILAYSAGAPVSLVWNRWFSFGNSFVVTSLLPPSFSAFSIASRSGFAGTCKSRSPPNAST